MPLNNVTDKTTTDEIAKMIGDDIFASDNAGANVEEPVSDDAGGETILGDGSGDTPGKEEKPEGNSSGPDGAPQTPTQPVKIKELPKSWKKDKQALWEKADPALHDYVHEREADVMRGIQMYSEGHNRWEAVTSPFKDVLSRYPDVTPEKQVQLYQNLMNSHLQLLTSPNKVELARQLLKAYNIDLKAVVGEGGENGDAGQPQVDPRLIALQREVESLRAERNGEKQEAAQRVYQENLRATEAFFSDAKNKYAEEVGDDILRFLQSGAAKDLPEAYEMACLINPAVRIKYLADQQGAGTPENNKPVKRVTNVDSSEAPGRTRRVAKDWRTEADEIAAKYSGTH